MSGGCQNIYLYIKTVKSNIRADQTVNERQKKRKELINQNTAMSKYYVAKYETHKKNPVNTHRKTDNTIDKVSNVKGNQKENSRY
jgi:hypothetical protein